MVDSVRENPQDEAECLDLLACIHGLGERDQAAFEVLRRAAEPLTADAVADRLGCDRSTAYRSVSRLLEARVVVQSQVNYDTGGYYHVYEPADPGDVAHDMRRLLNDWYASVSQRIHEFEHAGDTATGCASSALRR